MKPGSSMPHSQGFSSNPYPELIQPNSSCLILSSHLRPGLPESLFPVGLPIQILKTFLSFSFWLHDMFHLNLLDLITLTILGEVVLLI